MASRYKIAPYKSDMYKEVSTWYVAHGWPMAPVEDILPDVGFIALYDDEKLAVGFLYTTNSNMYLLEWTATNPKVTLKKRAQGLKLLVKEVQRLTKLDKPRARVMQFTPNKAIIRTYERLGFKKTDENTTGLCWS